MPLGGLRYKMASGQVQILHAVTLICLVIFRGVTALSSTTTSTTTTTASASSATVMIPPAITLSPASGSYRPSASIQLQCGATGTPTPTYTWFFNGVVLAVNQSNIVQQSGGTITISQATSSNTGYYQCVANNIWGTAVTDVAFIQMAVMNSFPGQTTAATLTVSQGGTLSMQCSGAPTSIPAATYGWSIVTSLTSTSGTAVSLSDRVQIGLNGALYFANAVSTDATSGTNLYSCNLHNSVLDTTVGGSYTSLTVTTFVSSQAAPTFAFSSSSPVSTLLGDTLDLYCFFYGNPTPTITWSGPNGTLPSGRYTLNNYNTQLTIINVELTDAGKYTCTGTNTLGSYSNQLTVNEYIAPTFTANSSAGLGPSNTNATNGDTVEINCSSSANPVAQIIWYQNFSPLTPSQLPTKFSLSADNSVLTITDVCKACSDGTSDLSVIQCNVSSPYGFAFGQAYINVLDSTVIQSISPNQSIIAGGAATLACQVSSDPSTPVNISWYQSDQQVQLTANTLASAYYVTNAALSQGGIYTCYATNGYSNASEYSALVVAPPVYASAADYWYLFLIGAIIIVLLLLIIFLFFCHKHNVGESYPVDDVEKENGNDPVKDLQDADFHDYQRPEEMKAQMTSSMPNGANDFSVDGESVNGDKFNNGPYTVPYYNKGVASSAPTMSANSDAVTGAGPRRIQLTGAAYVPTGYYPEELTTAADGDLDAALDDGSVAGSELRLQTLPRRPNANPGYAGSMPMLNEENQSPQGNRQLSELRRRMGGSAPTVLDDAWQLEPREFPADRFENEPERYTNPLDAWSPNRAGVAGLHASSPIAAAGYNPNVDRWIDEEPVRDTPLSSPVGGARSPIGPPLPAHPGPPYFDYNGRQMSYPPPPAAADDVFPVMYDDDDRLPNYDGYDDGRRDDPRRRPMVTMVRSPGNASSARSVSESSV